MDNNNNGNNGKQNNYRSEALYSFGKPMQEGSEVKSLGVELFRAKGPAPRYTIRIGGMAVAQQQEFDEQGEPLLNEDGEAVVTTTPFIKHNYMRVADMGSSFEEAKEAIEELAELLLQIAMRVHTEQEAFKAVAEQRKLARDSNGFRNITRVSKPVLNAAKAAAIAAKARY